MFISLTPMGSATPQLRADFQAENTYGTLERDITNKDLGCSDESLILKRNTGEEEFTVLASLFEKHKPKFNQIIAGHKVRVLSI